MQIRVAENIHCRRRAGPNLTFGQKQKVLSQHCRGLSRETLDPVSVRAAEALAAGSIYLSDAVPVTLRLA